MRIWSIHPKYLDTKGLVALWRETLLAKNVLKGNTKGYKNHPQLVRFKNMLKPVISIDAYLHQVWLEATKRGYRFNRNKYDDVDEYSKLPVNSGQIAYERQHLLNKLYKRDLEKFKQCSQLAVFEPNPLFYITEGEIEVWEKL